MANLDRSRPYGEEWGSGRGALVQDGKLFHLDGSPVDADPEPVPAPAVEAAPKRGKPKAVEAPPPAADEFGLADRSDDELQALVEIAGGEWKGRDDAIATLGDAS